MDDVPHVLAIASRVTYGYVGNKMASFVMQVLGLDVSCIDTVHYSNHLGYGQATGRSTSAEELVELYNGLTKSGLDDFGILISGYCPSAAVVNEVGHIAKTKRAAAGIRGAPGSFFWVLDPVMGDNGKIYVGEDTVPAYRSLLQHADLILPNQFEAELLSGVKITNKESLLQAIATLHKEHGVPHVIITSVSFPTTEDSTARQSLAVIGSTANANWEPQAFEVQVPRFPIFFSGTGDMFAGLITARLREQARVSGCLDRRSWRHDTACPTEDLPLAKAVQQVLASMHAILLKTADNVNGVQRVDESLQAQLAERLRRAKAAEVRVVRHVDQLISPTDLADFTPIAI